MNNRVGPIDNRGGLIDNRGGLMDNRGRCIGRGSNQRSRGGLLGEAPEPRGNQWGASGPPFGGGRQPPVDQWGPGRIDPWMRHGQDVDSWSHRGPGPPPEPGMNQYRGISQGREDWNNRINPRDDRFHNDPRPWDDERRGNWDNSGGFWPRDDPAYPGGADPRFQSRGGGFPGRDITFGPYRPPLVGIWMPNINIQTMM